MVTTTEIETPLLEGLADLQIEVTIHRHPPLRTVEESKALRGKIEGVHIKNLFLRDKKKNLLLVTVLEDRRIDLKDLRRRVDARGNLSFGSADLLFEALGVLPGAVTPFAVMNDNAGRVRLVLDRDVLDGESPVLAHPLHNEATVAIASADLLRFLESVGHEPELIDF